MKRGWQLFVSLTLCGALAAGLALAPVHAAQQYQQNVSFATSNQSIWASGQQFTLDYSQLWGTSWNSSSAGGPGFHDVTIPGLCIPKEICGFLGCVEIPGEQICFPETKLGSFGAEASASTS